MILLKAVRISRRRNTSRLFTIGDSRQATPVRALMDELEHVGSAALISGTNSSMGNNSSGNGGLWETLTSDDDGYGGVPALATSLSNEERVALIVNRLSLWRRRRHDEELIETWDEWWLSRPFKSKLHLNTIKQTPDLIEAYQLLWLADPFLGISECLNICAAANAFSSGGGLTTNVNRGLTLYELELGLIACPEGSQTLAACMSALLATPRERTNLANALASLPSVGSGQVSEINVSGSNGLSGDIDPESASTESCGNVASAQSGCATFSASISGEASPSTWSSSSLLGRFVKRRGASGSSGRSIRSLAQTVAPLPYAVWERRLAARVASWYRAMREKGKGEPSWVRQFEYVSNPYPHWIYILCLP
ncbi:unnamed protein product [Protopolystoma xenopodis]|uniref:Uncharacterized protein n=1 Tax=Protopolystoma xenopodis TaxID=117903 RepID=A0A3S5BVV2_9PLAT|nr:unnamed protein product [Protopolystoma xenopodis]